MLWRFRAQQMLARTPLVERLTYEDSAREGSRRVMIAETSTRVSENTAETVNQRMRRQMAESVSR